MQINALLLMILAADKDGTRGVVPEDVVQARPKPASPKGTAANAPKYLPAAGATLAHRPAAAMKTEGSQVGVTIWRLRSATPADGPVRILVQDDANSVEWVPERVASTSRLKAGDRVRLTIESPESGYLYVIDRERYANGQRGEPYLIFPTKSTRGGNNRVSTGQLIDIPAQEDRPNFFRLSQSRPDQTEEELSVLVTKEPIEGITISSTALRLSSSQYEEWEKKWGSSKVEQFELSGGAGKAWTQAEQSAAANATRILTQDDPAPQTVYRVLNQKANEPVLIKVHLRYR